MRWPFGKKGKRTADAALSKRYHEAASMAAQMVKAFSGARPGDPNDFLHMDKATLGARASFEIEHNGYAKGMTRTWANDLIGTKPRLQIRTGDDTLDSEIEREFALWAGISDNPVWGVGCCDIQGTKNLSTILKLACARHQDDRGEGLIVLTSDKKGPNNLRQRADRGVRLRLAVVHPDRLVTPWGADPDKVRDGIEYDENTGEPLYYYILKQHPNSTRTAALMNGYDKVPASHVIHYFQHEYAGQTHGEIRIKSSLAIYNAMRRYTDATVASAELAACLAAVLTGAEDPEGQSLLDYDTVEIVKGSMMTVPGGTKMEQFKAEQPTATYAEFKAELLNQAARPKSMPYNVAAGNSSKYNYASGRLDKQEYGVAVRNERSDVEQVVLARILHAWLIEAMLVPGFFSRPITPEMLRNATGYWYFDGREHVDPQKEANAQKVRLENQTATLRDEYAKQGKDWESELRQHAKEIELMNELGLRLVSSSEPVEDDNDEDEADESKQEKA